MTWHDEEQVVVLGPQGELYEGAECDELERSLMQLAGRGARVVVDLSETHQVSAHCLGVLAHAQETALRHGGRIALCGATKVQRWLLGEARLSEALMVYEDSAAAIRALSGAPEARRAVSGS
jgi:anti-anti-sigma factor